MKGTRALLCLLLALQHLDALSRSTSSAFGAIKRLPLSGSAPMLHLTNMGLNSRRSRLSVILNMSSEIGNEDARRQMSTNDRVGSDSQPSADEGGGSAVKDPRAQVPADPFSNLKLRFKPTPPRVEDLSVLLCDVFLLTTLSVSVSFLVVHRFDATYLAASVSEASLLSLCWIAAGLFHGAFNLGAVDGNYGSTDERRGGPKGAALLGFHTMASAGVVRVLVALVVAVLGHRLALSGVGEDLLILEIAFGIMLMTGWRCLHSMYAPRF